VFLREFLLANQKHSIFFWGQYTVHTGNRSLGSSDYTNGFSQFNSERKRVWPHTDPRSQRLVVQINQKDITGVENPLNFIHDFLFHTIDQKAVEYQIGEWFARPTVKSDVPCSIRACCAMTYDRFKQVIEIVLHESFFQNYWFCLIKCMQMFNTFVVAYKVRPEVNPGPAVERASLCQLN